MISELKKTYHLHTGDVDGILFHIKHNVIPSQLDDTSNYYDIKHLFLKETSDELFKQLEPLIKGLVEQSYKEGFAQGLEFNKNQPNGFN